MSMKNNHPASDADKLNSRSNPPKPWKKRKGTPETFQTCGRTLNAKQDRKPGDRAS